MAPIEIKFIVSFSSQDDIFKVQNLISGKECKKWLSNPKERSGQIEAIFQLEDFCQISHISIGTIWCSDIEIQVGRSDWSQDKSYLTLCPTANLMTPLEIRKGENMSKVRIFNKGDFLDNVVSNKWDRIKLLLRQRFRKDVQFGLSQIKVDCVSSNTSEKKTRTSSSNQEIKHIKDHFFGSKMKSASPDNMLKEKLLKISSSGESGAGQSLTRTAKLVLAAADNNNNNNSFSNVTSAAKRGLFSDHIARKSSPTFEEEVVKFLFDQKLSPSDLDSITVADLRHKYEKVIRRKLSKDEKQVFLQYCQSYLAEVIDGDINPRDNTKEGVAAACSSPNDVLDISSTEKETLLNSVGNSKTLVCDNNHNYKSMSDHYFSDDDMVVFDSEEKSATCGRYSPPVKCLKEKLKDSNNVIKNSSGQKTSKIKEFPVFKPSDPNSPINKLLKSKRKSRIHVDLTGETSPDESSPSVSSTLLSCDLPELTPSKRKRKNVEDFDNYEFDDDDTSSTRKKSKGRGTTKGRSHIRRQLSIPDEDESTSTSEDTWLTAGVGHKLGSSSSSSSSSSCSSPRSSQPLPTFTEGNNNMATCSTCGGKVKDYLIDHHILQCSKKSRLSDLDIPLSPDIFDSLKSRKPPSRSSEPNKSTFATLENRKEEPNPMCSSTSLNLPSIGHRLTESSSNASVVIDDDHDNDIMVACPVCTEMFPHNIITVHTNHCLDSMS